MSVLRRFWNEDEGTVLSAELVIYSTLLVIGILSGASAVQTAVVTELGDMASAIGAVNQSFSFGGVQAQNGTIPGSSWTDDLDTCDECDAQTGDTSACLEVCNNVRQEGDGAGGVCGPTT